MRNDRRFGAFDETRPRLTVGVYDSGSFTVERWANDLSTAPAFADVRTQLLALGQRVSDGAVAPKAAFTRR